MIMHIRTLKSDLLLLLTATIWGFAFVAQRVGMEHVGPFTFNGVRFALGSLSLLPLLARTPNRQPVSSTISRKMVILSGSLLGLVLFAGASLQQVGLVYTTAGKAAFITGLYVVLVPILGLFWKQQTAIGTWIGAILAVVGLYFLSITGTFTIATGDLLELIGAFFWAGHVQLIGWLARKINPIKISCFQFLACSILSLIAAIFFESITLQGILNAAIPILYGGLLSVGVAYTLQVVAQRDAHPAHAAILLSLESVFALIGGWLILHESLSRRGLVGCALMFGGMLVSQFNINTEHLVKLLKSLFHHDAASRL
jgi:drug/metabolite transporter (DMT)-like permease